MQLPAMMATRAAAWACLIKAVSSSPVISFPVNAQVPPVARISKTFSFVFADNTFTSSSSSSSASSSSSSSSMTYTLDSPPDWLSINSSERWLHGTPQDSDVPSGDVVGIPFGLVATDGSGSTTLNVTLVVSRNAAPTVEIPISQQLADSGLPYSEPSSILSYPDSHFNFSFSQSTFSSSGLNYYAVSGDNSPLPAWIAFDADQITFSGTTPPADSLVEPPQTFNFQLTASDVTGFSAASIGFSIVVGSREITADDPAVILNATVGKELVYDGLQQGIKLDGQVAGPSNLTAKVLSGSSPPDWLTFDAATWELSGTPPSSAQNAAFAISFSDALANAVNVTFQVDIDENGTVFSDTLPAMQAQRGGDFYLDLAPYLIQTTGVEVTVQTEPDEDWIQFDNSTLILSGNVPISETASSISVSVRATLESSKATESETFLLQIMSGSSSTNSSASPSASSASPTATSTAAAPASKAKSSSTSLQTILLAVLIPTLCLFFVLAVIACCFCCKRRRKRRELSQHLTNKDISDPVPFSFAYNGQEDIVSSMRALDKEYKVSNLNNAYAQQQINQEKEKLQAEEIPVGTALALGGGEARGQGQGQDRSDTDETRVSADDRSSIPDFPAPPLHTIPGQSSSSSSARSARSIRALAAAANGQWPFEESTLLSSVHTRNSSHADIQSSLGHGEDEEHRDALGIYGSVGSSSLSNQNSGSLITRQTVRTSTPMQLDVLSATEGDEDGAGGLRPEHRFSQEAIVHDGRSSIGTVVMHGGNFYDDSRSSIGAVADGSRSTLQMDHDDMEAGAAGGGGGMQRTGFLSGFAARIASRFKKGIPAPKARSTNKQHFSTAASGYPSPDAASFDTEFGSVTIGNITTAQPYKPRPVFIGSVNRINEESPQPNSQWWNRENGGSRASGAIAGGGGGRERQAHNNNHNNNNNNNADRRQQGYNEMGDEEGDDDGESIDGSDVAGDEAIRLDPPRPAFLAPSHAERDATDLSQDIASSLGNRRPTSTSSGMSGISAAMEEVRSLLLLPTDSPRSGGSRGHHSGSDDGLYPPSSNSWETLPSSEPNWTSVYESVQPGLRSGAAAATATDAGSDEPPTPATGAGISYGFSSRSQQHPNTGSPGSAAQHQAQARMRAQQAQARAAAGAAGPHAATIVTPEAETYKADDDHDLALTGRGYRHPSSYYGEPYAMTSNDYEYPPPFVAGDGAYHFATREEDHEDNSGGPGSGGGGSVPSIGLAVSKYSQPQLTRSSLASTVSSGIRAFI